MAREAVSMENLFAIIEREFTKVRPRRCKRCITPLPFRKTQPDDVSTNWSIVEPAECPDECRILFAEVVTRLMSDFELERSVIRGGPRRK